MNHGHEDTWMLVVAAFVLGCFAMWLWITDTWLWFLLGLLVGVVVGVVGSRSLGKRRLAG